jgi:lysophospholipase L1-like esterase
MGKAIMSLVVRAAVAVSLVVGMMVTGPTARAAVAFPSSMAAIGDSITQAADSCCFYGDHPGHNWSTGGASSDVVISHYERIQSNNPAIAGHAHDDAVDGSQMSDAPGQASQAVSQGAQYVTILMGANDACTSSISTMTPTDVFQSEFQQTMSTLENGLPSGAHIFVASIPNILRLWQLFHRSLTAESVWALFGICQSMLSPSNTSADRQTVYNQVVAYNQVLGQVCGQYANCLFDGDAVFNYQFSKSDVSKLDFFHPSLSGQANLAAVTWAASWWPTA